MKQTTLCIVKNDRQILLGLKKTGFGQGKYCGFGGKVEAGEGLTAAAIRELQEETGLRVWAADLQVQGRITYHFPSRPEWDLQMHLFTVRNWQGVPEETTEMRPVWFDLDQIPYGQMWDDARHWLPLCLADQTIEAVFYYDSTNERVAHHQLTAKKHLKSHDQ